MALLRRVRAQRTPQYTTRLEALLLVGEASTLTGNVTEEQVLARVEDGHLRRKAERLGLRGQFSRRPGQGWKQTHRPWNKPGK